MWAVKISNDLHLEKLTTAMGVNEISEKLLSSVSQPIFEPRFLLKINNLGPKPGNACWMWREISLTGQPVSFMLLPGLCSGSLMCIIR